MSRFLQVLSAPFRARSVGLQVGASVAMACFLLLIVGVALLYTLLVRLHEREDLADLSRSIEILRTTLRSHGDDAAFLHQQIQLESEAGRRSWGDQPERPIFFARILDEAGVLIAETQGMGRVAPVSVFRTPIAEKMHVSLPGHVVRWRVEQRPFDGTSAFARVGRDESGPVRIVQVALDRTDERGWMQIHRNASAGFLAAGALFAAWVGLWSARRALRPLNELARRVEQARGRDQLSLRVFDKALPAELVPLARSFDELLNRIEATYLRLGDFAAYAAHELRTPLQIMAGEAEAALSEERTPRAYVRLLESNLEEYGKLARLIENFLFVAQSWDPHAHIRRVPFDVRAELDSIQQYFEPLATEGRQVILCDGQGHIAGDVALFRRAVVNLVANALRHTPPLGRVSLSVGFAAPHAVSVKVTDTGSGIPPEKLAQIQAAQNGVRRAAPANRIDSSRGFGLQIARSIAELHGARLQISSELGHGTTAELLFPETVADPAPDFRPSTDQAPPVPSIAKS